MCHHSTSNTRVTRRLEVPQRTLRASHPSSKDVHQADRSHETAAVHGSLHLKEAAAELKEGVTAGLKAVTDTVKDVTHRAAEATKHAVQKPTEIDPDILAFEDLE
eukprot:14822-Heterococcus_DN1.PRE.3